MANGENDEILTLEERYLRQQALQLEFDKAKLADQKGPPKGWFKTFEEAAEAADISYGMAPELTKGLTSTGAPRVLPYEIIGQGGFFTFNDIRLEPEADTRYQLAIDEEGNTVAWDPTDPKAVRKIIFPAREKPPVGSEAIGNPINLGNGNFLVKYRHYDTYGEPIYTNVTIKGKMVNDVLVPDTVNGEDRTPAEMAEALGLDAPGEFGIIDLGDAGQLIPTGAGTYKHQSKPGAPFQVSGAEGAGDIIDLPKQNGSLIRIGPSQYQFVRQSYVTDDPKFKTYTDEQDRKREFTQGPSGEWTELPRQYDPDVIERGGREFVQQQTGLISELDPRYNPSMFRQDGMPFVQQRTGDIQQLTPATMDQIITQALVDGEYDKAFAFQDFQDRPTAAEAFQTALQFARSPADQVLISAIARGEQYVAPPPAGEIQRIGPQPDFLIQAYQDYQRRTQAGRAPTAAEVSTGLAGGEAGAGTVSDAPARTLQDQLLSVKIEGQEIINEGLRSKNTNANNLATQNLNNKIQEGTLLNLPPTPGAATPETSSLLSPGEPFSMSDRTTSADIDALEASMSPAQLEIINKFPGGIASFAQTAQNMGELVRNLNFHFSTVSDAPLVWPLLPSQEVAAPPQAAATAATVRTLGTAATTNMPEDMSEGTLFDPTQTIADTGTTTPSRRTGKKEEELLGLGWGPQEIRSLFGGSGNVENRAGGGIVGDKEITVVGEKGPEIAMFPVGTHILPLGKATKKDIRAARKSGRAYQTGGIVFSDIPGLLQLQQGRPITPPRGYLSRAAGLTLPSAQAIQNLTPESLDAYFDVADRAGIKQRAFGQELQMAIPSGTRLPSSRMLPLGRRGVR